MQASTAQNRGFGFIMAAACALIYLWRMFRHQQNWYALAAAALIFLAAALIAPDRLARPRVWWLAFGDKLALVTQPLILGAVFFLVLTPAGLLRRWFTRKQLQPPGTSHWIEEPRALSEDDFQRQF